MPPKKKQKTTANAEAQTRDQCLDDPTNDIRTQIDLAEMAANLPDDMDWQERTKDGSRRLLEAAEAWEKGSRPLSIKRVIRWTFKELEAMQGLHEQIENTLAGLGRANDVDEAAMTLQKLVKLSVPPEQADVRQKWKGTASCRPMWKPIHYQVLDPKDLRFDLPHYGSEGRPKNHVPEPSEIVFEPLVKEALEEVNDEVADRKTKIAAVEEKGNVKAEEADNKPDCTAEMVKVKVEKIDSTE